MTEKTLTEAQTKRERMKILCKKEKPRPHRCGGQLHAGVADDRIVFFCDTCATADNFMRLSQDK